MAISIGRRVLVATLMASMVSACVTEPAAVSQPAGSAAETGSAAAPSDADLWRSYTQMSAAYEKLWNRRSGREVARGRTDTIMGFPYLVLEARAARSKPDFYAYYPRTDGGDTMEFGAFFDRGGDARIDWLVFYGGTALAEGMQFTWWSHHAIDTNHDGQFDVFVVDAVDRDGDSLIEPGITAWLFDDDFDGRLDRGAFMQNGRSTPMRVTGGRLEWKRLTGGPNPKLGDPFLVFFDAIADDIEGLL